MAAIAYAMMVFVGSFLLTTIRVSFIISHLGVRATEFLEMPFLYLIIVMAAQQTISRFSLPDRVSVRLLTGFIGVGVMLAVDVLSEFLLFGRFPKQFFTERDPVSAAVYLGTLGMFALMPYIHLSSSR
jgi:hypothetical protein